MAYNFPENDNSVEAAPWSLVAKKALADKVICDKMHTWFLARYEDPVERCPYESAEGGYQFIHGGPYDAREVLEQEFGVVYDDDLIAQVAEFVSADTYEWSRIPDSADFG